MSRVPPTDKAAFERAAEHLLGHNFTKRGQTRPDGVWLYEDAHVQICWLFWQAAVRLTGRSKESYRDFFIYETDPVPPIPGWQEFAWTYCHEDYDGPEDGRYGHAPSPEACRQAIDEWHEEHSQ